MSSNYAVSISALRSIGPPLSPGRHDTPAAYKVSDDLIVELVGVTATVDDDSEGASAGIWWVQVVEPHELVKHQPPGGYMLDHRQIQMTCVVQKKRTKRDLGDDEQKGHSADAGGFASTSAPPGVQDGVQPADT